MGLLVFTALTEVQKRYQVLVRRLQRIAQLNQHVRDALQIILFTNVPERSAQAIKQVNAAVIRIESVLQEKIPASGSGRFWSLRQRSQLKRDSIRLNIGKHFYTQM